MMAAARRRRICCSSRCPACARTSGIALDGDGDRLVMVDHLGRIVDGDQLLYVIARARKRRRHAARPGGRHGDEQSRTRARAARAGHRVPARAGRRPLRAGHAARDAAACSAARPPATSCCLDKTTTGDGLVSALQVLAVMKRDRPARWPSWLPACSKFPQVLINVKVAKRFDPQAVPAVQEAVHAHRAAPGGRGPRGAARLGHRTGHPRHGRGPRRGHDRAPARSWPKWCGPSPAEAARSSAAAVRALRRRRVRSLLASLSSRALRAHSRLQSSYT